MKSLVKSVIGEDFLTLKQVFFLYFDWKYSDCKASYKLNILFIPVLNNLTCNKFLFRSKCCKALVSAPLLSLTATVRSTSSIQLAVSWESAVCPHPRLNALRLGMTLTQSKLLATFPATCKIGFKCWTFG